jgi:hypothetical protein
VPGQPQPGRGQQDQGADAVRRGHGQLGGQPAAERRPHHVRPVQPEPVHHVEVVVDEVVHRLHLGEVVRLAEPGMIGRDHVEPGRQPPVELEPAPRPARRVQEQHRLTLPAAKQMDAAAVE